MKKILKYIIMLLVVIISLLLIVIYMKKDKEYSVNLFYMDTYINVKIYTDRKDYNDILTNIDSIYKEYHQLTDRYNSYSGINNVYYINNNETSDQYIQIDNKLYKMIEYSLNWYNSTNGLFNINMGNVIDVWKASKQNNIVPNIEDLLIQNIDINNIILKDDIYIKNTHPNIDLGGISKGYTTKIAGEYLNSEGIDKFIINAGGNVLVGEHYNNDYYQIGIESPIDQSIYQVLKLNSTSVVTSGGYERFFEVDGEKYHHIIDPKTLFPSNYMKSVTVITKDSAKADVLSTTLFLMDIESGKKFVEQFDDVEVIWFDNEDNVIKTEGIYKYE